MKLYPRLFDPLIQVVAFTVKKINTPLKIFNNEPIRDSEKHEGDGQERSDTDMTELHTASEGKGSSGEMT